MKKILFVANVAKEHINKFHIPSIVELKKQGWQVDVACACDDDVEACDNLYRMNWKRSPFSLKTIQGVFELRKIVNSNRYDVVYCHTPVGGFVARLASRKARKTGTKVIYCAHGLHFFCGAPIINWMIYYPIEKYLAHFTDAMILINDEDYARVKRRFRKKMNVYRIPGIGVDFARLNVSDRDKVRAEYREKLNIPADATVLIYIAELTKNKNQTLAMDALKIVNERGGNMYMIFAGPDHLDGGYQKYAADIGISDNVRFLGWRNDVGELFSASDICVATSIREGFGLNLVEAMYCGLPVIATDNRGHSTVVHNGENGILVPLGDPKQLAATISRLDSDTLLREKLTGVSVDKYDCAKVAHMVYQIISSEEAG